MRQPKVTTKASWRESYSMTARERTRRAISDAAADRVPAGLDIWKTVMDDFPAYRDDELKKKDTGQIVKRYVQSPAPATFSRYPTTCRSRTT